MKRPPEAPVKRWRRWEFYEFRATRADGWSVSRLCRHTWTADSPTRRTVWICGPLDIRDVIARVDASFPHRDRTHADAMADLREAVRIVARGNGWLAPRVMARKGTVTVYDRGYRPLVEGKSADDVLDHVAEAFERTVTCALISRLPERCRAVQELSVKAYQRSVSMQGSRSGSTVFASVADERFKALSWPVRLRVLSLLFDDSAELVRAFVDDWDRRHVETPCPGCEADQCGG